MKIFLPLGIALSLLAVTGIASAQAPPPPPAAPAAPPAAAPPPASPLATPPPLSTSGTPASPPTAPQNVAKDANGNPLPPPSGANAGQPTTGAGAYGVPQTAAGPQPAPFAMIDREENGAIKLDQARGDPWLAANFVTCDRNHNEEVTEKEYETCVDATR